MRALALLAAITIGILWVGVAAALHSQHNDGGPARQRMVAVADERPGRGEQSLPGEGVDRPARPIFRHSVVPGGVHAAVDVARAMAADPVVAAHYAGVDVRRLQVRRLAQPLLAHVSYRVGNEIRWTSRKLQLAAGELVLTDGTTMLRARCGNMVPTYRRTPTFAGEPESIDFDQVIEPDAVQPDAIDPGPVDPGTFDPDPEGIAFRGIAPPMSPRSTVPSLAPGSRLPPVAIPEPGSLALLGFAAVGFVAIYIFGYRRHGAR